MERREQYRFPILVAAERQQGSDAYGAAWARRMDKAFDLQSVKYQHTITNDNVTDVEIGLTVAQLFRTDGKRGI